MIFFYARSKPLQNSREEETSDYDSTFRIFCRVTMCRRVIDDIGRRKGSDATLAASPWWRWEKSKTGSTLPFSSRFQYGGHNPMRCRTVQLQRGTTRGICTFWILGVSYPFKDNINLSVIRPSHSLIHIETWFLTVCPTTASKGMRWQVTTVMWMQQKATALFGKSYTHHVTASIGS